ncbi:MAG: DUF4190 domain-containing protein [Protaetiibacter sp.]
MSDPQQPGATGDQIPPIPPAPGAEVPPAPQAPAAPEAPVAPDAASAPVPPAVPPVADAAPAAPENPYAQPAQNPYAAQPQQQNPYAAAPAGTPAFAAGTPAYAAAPAAPSRLNVMGLISLIAGGLAFLLGVTAGWIPFVGFAFVFIALVGVVLGIVGLLAKNKGKGLAIAGTIVSGIALLLSAIISIFMLFVFTSLQQNLDDLRDFGPDDPVITDPDGGETQTDDDPNALGSQNNPAAPGDTITFTDLNGDDEWQLVVGAPVLDATADVLAADQYNSAPDAGNQYVVVPVTYTYVGSESGSPFLIFTQISGSDAALYDTSYAEYPNSLYDAPELSSGGTAEVNLVFQVPSNAVAGSQLKLGSIWGNDIFVALD